MYGGTGDLLHFREAPHERLSLVIGRNFMAGDLAKRLLFVIESRLASPAHLSPKLQPVRGGSSELKSHRVMSRKRVSLCQLSGEFANLVANSCRCTADTFTWPSSNMAAPYLDRGGAGERLLCVTRCVTAVGSEFWDELMGEPFLKPCLRGHRAL